MPEDEESIEQSAFTQRDLPEWVKSLGLPPAATDAIDRYWKPAWDAIKDTLPLLPIHAGRLTIDSAAGEGVSAERICFESFEERTPGERWQASFQEMWPAYRAWYLRDGDDARPDLATCRERLHQHMPELVATYERLVELAGGDEVAARCLSLYRPPAFIVGCSQAVWTRGQPMLVRNYDYPAARLEGIVIKTDWAGQQIIGMSDCLWGLLDGMNDEGLVVSLTFGGRRAVGDGFAIPLVVRYLLETCQTVQQAREKLQRLPIHAAQNLSLLDNTGEHLTAYLAPDRTARAVSRAHQRQRTIRAVSTGPSTRAPFAPSSASSTCSTLLADAQISSAHGSSSPSSTRRCTATATHRHGHAIHRGIPPDRPSRRVSLA